MDFKHNKRTKQLEAKMSAQDKENLRSALRDSKKQSTSGILNNLLDDENEGDNLFLDNSEEPDLDTKEAANEKIFMAKLQAQKT